MKKKLATLALCMCAIQSIAADVCAEGDEKCGPDGHVLKCEKLISMDARWRWTPATATNVKLRTYSLKPRSQ